MGYEIVYFYHERLPDGKWNTEERLEMKKKIGGVTEEVELEKLAAIILGQLAKRDKLVVDVEVYEYTKKKVNYKEATDGSGIILKNKKYSTGTIAGQLNEEVVGELVEESAPSSVLNVSRPSTTSPNVTWMVFEPEIQHLMELKPKGFKLTQGKKYPVLSSRPQPSGIGSIITTRDDGGKEITISDEYFVVNSEIRLEYDQVIRAKESQTLREPRLSYQHNPGRVEPQVDMSVPNLRPHLSREVR